MTEIGAQLEAQWEKWGATDRLELIIPATGHYVYVAWGVDERPLYVGKSRNFFARMGQHSTVEPWYVEAVRFELYAFDSDAAAIAAEIEAIQALNPIWNRMRWPTPAQRAVAAAEKEAKRHAYYARLAAAKSRQASKPAPLPRPPKQLKLALTPKQVLRKRRVRPAKELKPDIFTPEQLEIIRRVQDRDWQKP